MKFSLCVPQYNRIAYLLKSLSIIEKQTYPDIEVVVSDDGSTDDTELKIFELQKTYKYPIIFSKNPINKGYDYNYRKCLELGTGMYGMVLGNDDSLCADDAIEHLVHFLEANNYPDLGYCNCIDERAGNVLMKRTHREVVLGTGVHVALKNYSCFSFVGGLIYKKETFNKYNTDKHDGSVFAQTYMGTYMIASGCTLFAIEKPLVLKDILIDNVFRNSYRDRIAKKWKDFKVVDGGMPQVMNVLISSFADAGVLTQDICFFIFKRMYSITYPFWIQDYKSNGALPEAVGLIIGMRPGKTLNFDKLNFFNRVKLRFIYAFSSLAGLLIPNFLFKQIQKKLYERIKKQG